MHGPRPQGLVYSRLFTMPKEGKSDAEYEDACAIDVHSGIYVVSDGASDSAFSGLWARLLARRFVEAIPGDSDPASWREWIAAAQSEWENEVRKEPVPWYVEPKIRQGAFATCVALILRSPSEAGGPHRWGAVAIGDSCLFHVQSSTNGTTRRRSQAAGGFPLSDAHAFNLHPLALSSNAASNEVVWAHVAATSDTWLPGDKFVLATDAMAQWIMEFIVTEGKWEQVFALLEAEDDAAFRELVARERSAGHLHNDDVTLLILRSVPTVVDQTPPKPVMNTLTFKRGGPRTL